MSSFLTSKPVIALTAFVLGIALCIQIDLILRGCSFKSFISQLLLQCMTIYSKSTTPYQAPTSIGNHIIIDHNLCTNKMNKIASCQSVGFDKLIESIMPNMADILKNKPNTLLQTLGERNVENRFKQPPLGTYYEYFNIEDIAALLIHRSPKLTKKKLFTNGIIIHIHGGAFISGTFKSDHQYLSYLHLFTRLPVLAIDYRLAPQYPLQSGALLEDGRKVLIDYLHDHLSVDFNKIYITGTSAGGGAVLIWMHEFAKQDKYFGGVIPISGWNDLRILSTVDSYLENNDIDSMLNYEAMLLFQMYALGCRDSNGDLVDNDLDQCIKKSLNELNKKQMNPMQAPWSDWSSKNKSKTMKILFIASQYEILRDDTINAHNKALKAGIDSELIMAESRTHGLPLHGIYIPEGLELIVKISHFINSNNLHK